jgi:hypothetical protein
MIQSGHGASFLFEAAEAFTIARERFREDLDGDVAAEARVVGAIDFAHSAGADFPNDAVVRYVLASVEGRFGHASLMLGGGTIQVNELRLFLRAH